MKKFLGVAVAVILLGAISWFYFRYERPFGEGVKAGTLNYVVYKGYIWKTYEGEVILAGFQNKPALQSNEFTFSIESEAVAKKLELASGKEVQLHYHEYLGALPWRGVSKFVVDSVVSIR